MSSNFKNTHKRTIHYQMWIFKEEYFYGLSDYKTYFFGKFFKEISEKREIFKNTSLKTVRVFKQDF